MFVAIQFSTDDPAILVGIFNDPNLAVAALTTHMGKAPNPQSHTDADEGIETWGDHEAQVFPMTVDEPTRIEVQIMISHVAIVHVYPNMDFTFRDGPLADDDRREVVGLMIQADDETSADFDKRLAARIKLVSNETYREAYDRDGIPYPPNTTYLDNKVYSGYLEVETVNVWEQLK